MSLNRNSLLNLTQIHYRWRNDKGENNFKIMNPVRNLTKKDYDRPQKKESIFNVTHWQRGQSLVELLLAIAVFIIVVSSLSFLILDSYVLSRLSQEMTTANFLAEEGLEATRSIRDNSWDDLSIATHGLATTATNWVFQGTEEDVSYLLNSGVRKVFVEEIADDKRKVTSEVTWQFSEGNSQAISLVTYLTNWAKIAPYLAQAHYRWRYDDGGE